MNDSRHAIHLFLTAVMAWLGFVLAWPGDTFANSSSYGRMSQIATEPVWAMVFWLTATIGFSGLTTQSRLWRLVSVLTVSAVHMIFALLLLSANPISTGSGTYALIAFLGTYLAWRRSREGV